MPPAQRLGDGVGRGVGEQGQDEGLGVPEGVPVVAGAGEALGGYRAAFGAGSGLQDVEEGEADGLLDLVVAVHLDVGAGPEVVEVRPLFGDQTVPAAVRGGGEGGVDLVAHGGQGPVAGPAVRDEFLHAQPLPRLQHAADGQPGHIGGGLAARGGAFGPGDDVVGGRGDAQAAAPGAVHQPQPVSRGEVLLGFQRGLQGDRGARVPVGVRELLVGDQLGLDDHAGPAADGLHLVGDGCHGPLGEGDEPGRAHPDAGTGRGDPLARPPQQAGAQIQGAFVGDETAVAQIERLVVDEQAQDLAVGDVDDGLPGLRIAVAGLGVGQRVDFVDAVEVGAGQAVRFALVEVAAPADMAVGQGEDGLALGEDVEAEFRLAHRPRFDGVRPVCDHASPPNPARSARSLTTTSAPCAYSASVCPTRSMPTTYPK